MEETDRSLNSLREKIILVNIVRPILSSEKTTICDQINIHIQPFTLPQNAILMAVHVSEKGPPLNESTQHRKSCT